MALNIRKIDVLPHHEQKETCSLRLAYRQGRKDTAVKVYTINLESTYLLIMGVPAVGANQELEAKCHEYGVVAHFVALDEYPGEEFTEVYLVRFEKLQSARIAKRKLDSSSFFGGILHVCFAPEFESVDETREKLVARQKYVSICTNSGFTGPWDVRRTHSNVSAKPPPMTSDTTPSSTGNLEPTSYIWAGKTYYTQPTPPPSTEHAGPSRSEEPIVTSKPALFIPRQALIRSKRPTDETTTTTTIRNKLQKLNAPNLPVTFKRRKT